MVNLTNFPFLLKKKDVCPSMPVTTTTWKCPMVVLWSVSLSNLWQVFLWGLRDSTLRWRAEQALPISPIRSLGFSQPAGSLSREKSPDGDDGNKMETQWFWVFSRPSNGPVPFFLCFISELQTFLLSEVCFRGLWASNLLNLFQVRTLLLSPFLVMFLLSSSARALLNLSTPESFAHSFLEAVFTFSSSCSSDNTNTKDSNFESPLFSYTISLFQLYLSLNIWNLLS